MWCIGLLFHLVINERRTDVPIRIRNGIVQIHVRKTAMTRVVTVATSEHQSHHKSPLVHSMKNFIFLSSISFVNNFFFSSSFGFMGVNPHSPFQVMLCDFVYFVIFVAFARERRTEVPIRIRNGIVQHHARQTATTRVVTAATSECYSYC